MTVTVNNISWKIIPHIYYCNAEERRSFSAVAKWLTQLIGVASRDGII